MTIYLACALIAAGLGGGIAASVASVASVVSYPALLALGLPPLAANVTNTMALVFSVPGGMLGSRQELAGQRDRVLRLAAFTAAGGAVGAAVLLVAPPGAFAYVVPVLIAGSRWCSCCSRGSAPWPRAPAPSGRGGGSARCSAWRSTSATSAPRAAC